MKKVSLFAITIFAVFMSFASLNAETGELTVVSAKPSGFIYENVGEITVVFSHDIVAINRGDDLNPPVSIMPEIEGRWTWKSPKQITFYPDDKIDQNRKYTVKVNKALKSFDGKRELKKNYSFVFVNNANRVTSCYLHSNGEYSDYSRMKLEDTITLSFVHPPLSAEVDQKITVTDKSTGKIVPVKVKFRKDPKSVDVIFKSKLKNDSAYRLEVDYTLRSDAGDMGLASDYSAEFRTMKKILLVSHTKENVKPRDPVVLKFTEYISSDDLIGRITVIRGKNDTLKNDEMELWQSYDSYDSPAYNLYFYKDGESEYRIVLPKGYGKAEGKEYSFKVKSLPYDPEFDLNGTSFLLESYKSGMIPVKSINCDSVLVTIYRINENDTDKVLSSYVQVSTKKNRYQTVPIRFKELVKGESGFYRLVLGGKKQQFFDCNVNFTRYALMAKLSYDRVLILAYDLETGNPVKDGEVVIPSRNLRGKTDKNGVCEIKCSLSKMERDGYGNLMIFFCKDRETSVLKVDDNSYGPEGSRNLYASYNYQKVYDNDWSLNYYKESRIRMYVYTDRGLYKPGETVYVKGIKRELNEDSWDYSKNKKVSVRVTDSREAEIMKFETELNKYGTFAFACTLSSASPTGTYTVESKSGSREERSYFRVEEFKPLEFDVTLASNTENVFRGDKPAVSVMGRYMFGSSMSGDSIRWKISTRRYSFSPKNFPGYSFYSGQSYEWNDEYYYYGDYGYSYSTPMSEGSGILDSDGMYIISEKIEPKNVGSPVMITYSATVKSASGQEITRSTNMVYHPTKVYVGTRPLRYVFDAKNPPVISIVAVDEAGKRMKSVDCSIAVINERYVSVKKTGTYGRTYWEYSYVEDTVANENIAVRNGGMDYKIKKSVKTGYYRVVLKYSDKEAWYEVRDNFYFAGEDDGWWQVRNDNFVEVIPDRRSGEYNIGDKAKVMIKSPFKNLNGYVTVEREGIYQKFPIKMKSNTQTVEVPITEEMLPNAYFSVFLYKGRSSNEIEDDSVDIGKPYFGVGFCNLGVSSEKRRQRIEIKIDKESYKPQETVTGSVKVLSSDGKPATAEVSIAVVDLGILNLIGFETPSPFREFYSKRNHDVSLSTNAGDIVGERNYGEKGENRGGDGGMSKFRTEFLPIIYYKAQVETDKNGVATFSFKLPDNLTTFRIMAVSCNKTDFGNAEKDFTVSKDFMITPSLPNFVRSKDEFTGGVVAVNMTKKEGEFTLQCSADGAEIVGDSLFGGNLAVNGKREVRFSFKVNEKADTVVLKFRGALGPEKDNLEIRIPVRKNPLMHVAGIFESTEEKSSSHFIDMTGLKSGELSVSLSSTGLNDLKEAAEYLFDYPYGCLEQQTSRVFPLIIGEKMVNSFDISEIKGEKLREIVQNYLNSLPLYQQSDGGFSIWSHKGDPSSPYLSNYVVYVMLYAKKNGYKVNEKVLSNAISYVGGVAGKTNKSSYYDYYSQNSMDATSAFASYVLKESGRPYESYVQQFSGKLEQMDGEALAWMLLLTENSAALAKLKERVKERIAVLTQYEGIYAYFNSEESVYDEIYGSEAKTNAMLLFAMLEDKGKNLPDAEKYVFWLLKRRTAGGWWASTQENAFVILALDRYFTLFESNEPDYNATVSLNKKKIFEEAFRGYSFKTAEKNALIDGGGTKEVTVGKDGKGRLYYKIFVSYDSPFEGKAVDNGFTVERSIMPYQHSDTSFVRGRLYTVTLKVKTKSDRLYVAVDNPIPAGFEIVNADFVTNSLSENGGYGYEEDGYYEDYGWWFGSFNHSEKYFDRYLLFADYLGKGEYTQSFIVKAIYPGRYYMPPAKAEEMYAPNNYGASESGWVEIK